MEGSKTTIRVKVLPRSSRNQIVGQENGLFKVKLTAPPVEGKANKALSDILTKKLGLPKGSVEIISGKRSRLKSVRIHGRSIEDVKDLLKRDV
ncbi:MAG: YggU family protein [Deltaproteobacteria bacterium]|nr:YggU family protein [Deltaproteobacteria bacterium]MBW1910087.1 YggU family protein [Deltaproteobacteria bacterium]MBW2034163.1 YggU family protein [Deltaproteobacteria bacterium]MBW2114523.1 YggU family protein [Deltaproteobacteria bacterium]MBW2168656.1 YggU family protein [Deltaproteobacteria bacterium]